jgi:acetate kinase
MAKEDLSVHEATTLLNKHSGLYGISGVSGDMRELQQEAASGHTRAQLAIDVFTYRIRKYIAAYCGVLGNVDGLIFTGGIGENAPSIRAASCERLGLIGIEIDTNANAQVSGKEAVISSTGSRVKVCVIPTNEELLIARDSVRTVLGIPHPN